jgi:ABC-type multidrug transport system fused ATPase/permease subunit
MPAVASASEARPRTLVEWACAVQPYHVLLAGLLPGFALIFGSLALGVGYWTARAPEHARMDREVGYIPALNWSVTYAILFPLALYLMTTAVGGLAAVLDRLHERGMVRDSQLQPVAASVLTADWLAGARIRSRLLVLFAVIMPAAFALFEWFPNNLLRLMKVLRAPHYSDWDWGLAGVMASTGRPEWSLFWRWVNAGFDLMAFATEALLIGSLLAFFLVVLDLGRVVPSGRRGETLLLTPDLQSRDRRLGFEEFAPPLEKLLGVALAAYLICYLVRLEGAYMASDSSSSLADFISNDILSGALRAFEAGSFSRLAQSLFNFGEQQARGLLAWMMSVIIAVISLVTMVITVREAALAAKSNALQALANGLLPFPGVERETAKRKVEAMAVWPLGYLKLDVLAVWVLIAVITLFLYRVGLFVAAVVALSLIFRLVRRLLRPEGKPASGSRLARTTIVTIPGSHNTVTIGKGARGGDVDKSLNITSGGDTNISGSTLTVASQIADSFHQLVRGSNADEALKQELAALNDAVVAMCRSLPEDQAKQVQRDIEALHKEAIAEKPRQRSFEVYASAIRDAVQTVGAVAAPVMEAVKAVAALLHFNSPSL